MRNAVPKFGEAHKHREGKETEIMQWRTTVYYT